MKVESFSSEKKSVHIAHYVHTHKHGHQLFYMTRNALTQITLCLRRHHHQHPHRGIGFSWWFWLALCQIVIVYFVVNNEQTIDRIGKVLHKAVLNCSNNSKSNEIKYTYKFWNKRNRSNSFRNCSKTETRSSAWAPVHPFSFVSSRFEIPHLTDSTISVYSSHVVSFGELLHIS